MSGSWQVDSCCSCGCGTWQQVSAYASAPLDFTLATYQALTSALRGVVMAFDFDAPPGSGYGNITSPAQFNSNCPVLQSVGWNNDSSSWETPSGFAAFNPVAGPPSSYAGFSLMDPFAGTGLDLYAGLSSLIYWQVSSGALVLVTRSRYMADVPATTPVSAPINVTQQKQMFGTAIGGGGTYDFCSVLCYGSCGVGGMTCSAGLNCAATVCSDDVVFSAGIIDPPSLAAEPDATDYAQLIAGTGVSSPFPLVYVANGAWITPTADPASGASCL